MIDLNGRGRIAILLCVVGSSLIGGCDKPTESTSANPNAPTTVPQTGTAQPTAGAATPQPAGVPKSPGAVPIPGSATGPGNIPGPPRTAPNP